MIFPAKKNEIVGPSQQKISDWLEPQEIKLFRGIGGVKAANSTQMVTPEQAKFYVEELKRCKNDIIHFAENWFYIISYRGKEKIKLYDKQKEMLRNFVKYPFNIVLSGRQQGKCLCKNQYVNIRFKYFPIPFKIKIGTFYKLQKTIFYLKQFFKK